MASGWGEIRHPRLHDDARLACFWTLGEGCMEGAFELDIQNLFCFAWFFIFSEFMSKGIGHRCVPVTGGMAASERNRGFASHR